LADEDSLDKAARIKAKKKKNLEAPANGTISESFLSFPNDSIAAMSSDLGICLGPTESCSTSFVNDLKKLEKERLSVDASGGFNNPVISVEEVEDELDFVQLNNLCGGVVQGVSEDEASDLFDLHASPTVRISSSQRKKRKGKRRSSTSR